MADHLPECWLHDPCCVTTGAHVQAVAGIREACEECEEECICDRLRACEQRVRERCALEIDHGPQMGNSLEWMLNPIRKHHYERGLDAAREAVAATYSWPYGTEPQNRVAWLSDALTAIDNLKRDAERDRWLEDEADRLRKGE